MRSAKPWSQVANSSLEFRQIVHDETPLLGAELRGVLISPSSYYYCTCSTLSCSLPWHRQSKEQENIPYYEFRESVRTKGEHLRS